MNKKIILAALTFIAIFLIAVSFYVYSNKKVTTGVNIVVVPADSKIILDGKTVSSGNNSTKPGKHTIEVMHDNFNNDKKTVSVSDNQVKLVAISLSSSNSDGKKWQDSHQSEYLELEATTYRETQQKRTNLANRYPLIKSLPKDLSPAYRIDYGISKKYPDDQDRIAIYVRYDNPTNKFAAIKTIYDLGYDPSDYEIIFVDKED